MPGRGKGRLLPRVVGMNDVADEPCIPSGLCYQKRHAVLILSDLLQEKGPLGINIHFSIIAKA